MIAIHIRESDDDLVVSSLDCVLARYDRHPDRLIEFLVELLRGLGHNVELEDNTCPVCGARNALVQDTRDLHYNPNKGQPVPPFGPLAAPFVIPDVTGRHCDACGDCLLDPAESRRVSDHMLGKKP